MATALPPLSVMDFTTYNDMDVKALPNARFKARKRRRRRRKYVRLRQQAWRIVLLCCSPLCQLHEAARVAQAVANTKGRLKHNKNGIVDVTRENRGNDLSTYVMPRLQAHYYQYEHGKTRSHPAPACRQSRTEGNGRTR